MKTRTHHALRVTLATVCSLALTLPAAARARVAEPAAELAPEEASDELPRKAEEHVVKALKQFEGGAYGNAEEELRRAAFFAPKWRTLHFNLAVVAEAQGKLGTALREYQSFKPYASPDEGMVVDQRIQELKDRRTRIASGHKRQIASSAIAMSLGVLALGGAGALIGISVGNKKTIDSNEDKISTNAPGTQIADLMSENARLTSQRTKFLYASYFLVIGGLLAVAYSFVPLTKAIKSKRQLDGLALGPTRLHWDGGAGVRLRF